MLNTAMKKYIKNTRPKKHLPVTNVTMNIESVTVHRTTKGATDFLPIFKILIETKSIPLSTGVRCLMTCKTMYRCRKWFGDRRPMYKMICIEQYQKRKKEQQIAFFAKTKVFRKKEKTQKALKKYNQLKNGVFEKVLKRIDTDTVSSEKYRRNLVSGKKGRDLKTSTQVFNNEPGLAKFVRLLARKSIGKKFNVELTEFISIQYSKLALLSGPGRNNGNGYRSHCLIVGVWVDTQKRQKTRSKRGGKRTKKKDNQPRGRKKCPGCGGYH
jgi:hypothetical protein